MPGRKFTAGNLYRYGFGGQEMSNEIKGIGNSYTAEFWEYDPRIGRRWNVDPIFKEYESAYAAFGNNPIWLMDINGADTTVPKIGDWYRSQEGKNVTYKYATGNDKKELDANSKTWWKIPESSTNRTVTLGESFAPTEVQSSIDLHADGTFTVLKTDIREGSVEGHIEWHLQLPNQGNVYVEARDYMQSKAVGDGAFWGAAGALAGEGAVKLGGTVLSKIATKTSVAALDGSFSITELGWQGYPKGIPRPKGPFRLLQGEEYAAARAAANNANRALGKELGLQGKFVDIHEITPVKFGGSPTNIFNKVFLDRTFHQSQVTPFWNNIMKGLQ